MEELQVPTHLILVAVHTDDGEELLGALFLAEGRYGDDRAAELMAVLNDERAFLPFESRTREGRVHRSLILNKDHILRVHLSEAGGWQAPAETGTAEDATRAEAAPVVVLADGTRISGRVAVETPWASSRLVDKLNHSQRFIPVVTDTGVDFVQRIHVMRVD
jgi:hypothetical protein